MLHLAEITEIHKGDEFYRKNENVKRGDEILWLTQEKWEWHGRDKIGGYETGAALLKNGRKVTFYAIKTRRLN